MKKNSILIAAVLTVFTLGFQAVSAQVTITLPKFPKIKKPKVEQPATTTATVSDDTQTNQGHSASQNSSSSNEAEAMDSRLTFFLEEIAATQKAVDKFTPDEYIYLVSDGGQTEWLWRAVSQAERNKWFEKWQTLLTPASRNKFDTALAALAASAAKKLPTYVPNPKSFAFHNPGEEKMMKEVLKNPANFKIYKIGINQASWLIDKNDYGLPTARYKHGMIYLRDTTDDHSYCYMTFVNIIQDYAGGGTYGASYARFIKDEMVGCPAGK